jgi:hypothetical protein
MIVCQYWKSIPKTERQVRGYKIFRSAAKGVIDLLGHGAHWRFACAALRSQ